MSLGQTSEGKSDMRKDQRFALPTSIKAEFND